MAEFTDRLTDEHTAMIARQSVLPGTRQIFDVAVESVQPSSGWGVPLMTLDQERQTPVKYHAQATPAAWGAQYEARTRSIDGLPVRPTDCYVAGNNTAAADD